MKKKKEYEKLENYSMNQMDIINASYNKDLTPEWQYIKWEIENENSNNRK